MMFAKDTQQMKMVGTIRCAMAESKLDVFVRFFDFANTFIFVNED